MFRAALTPSRCPATRGNPRCVAHRPLPSMITAICRGSGRARTRSSIPASPRSPGARSVGAPVPLTAMGRSSHRTSKGQNFLLLLLQELVDLRDVLVRGLLDLLVTAPLLVLRDLLVFRHGLQLVVGLAADTAHHHPRLLGHLVNGLHELLAPFLGGARHGQAKDLPVVDRGDPEIRGDERLLDGLELRGLPPPGPPPPGPGG